MSKSELLLAGLLATAIAGTAWAQTATKGGPGSATSVGNYDFGGSLGGASSRAGQPKDAGAASGAADSSAFGGSYSIQGGSGLPAGVSALPSVGTGSTR
jgi:hypothetical protein